MQVETRADVDYEEYHRKATTDAKKVVTASIRLACGARLAICSITINCSEKRCGNGQRKDADRKEGEV